MSDERNAMLSVDGICKNFGEARVLENVNFEVGPGEVVGILGKNGAGKSTLLSLISGVNSPSAGCVRILGENPRNPSSRRLLGVTPQGTGLDNRMSVVDFLKFVSFHYVNSLSFDEVVDMFGLSSFSQKVIGNLSGGQQRLVAVASAFIADAPLTLLDEPTTGLDTVTRSRIWETVRGSVGNNPGKSLIITSHYIEEIETLCDRVLILDGGTITADASVRELARASRSSIISLSDVDESAIRELSAQRSVVHVSSTDLYFTSSDVKSDLSHLGKMGYPFEDIKIVPPSLEQAFLQITGK